ncbi:MAG: hypothetical protein IVW57_17450, partial [Ktedonobacterales bacterium]|nr:hypothetical protein [Ktedonobacterales bacterium]
NSSAWGFANLLFVGHRTAPLFVGASDVARPLALVIIAVSVVALVWLTLARRHRSFAEDDLTFLAYLPVMLLASPLMWEHYFVILMLPLVVLGSRLGWLRRAPPRASVSAAHSVRWLVGSALALIELNYLLGLLPLPATLPWAFGPFFYALPTYALALFLIAFLWAGARVSGDAELAVSMPAVVRASV